MIALDTNVLLRYFIGDDPAQAKAAAHFFEEVLSEAEPGFVSLPVLCELVWSLGYSYGFSRDEIAGAVLRLLDARQIEVEEADMVGRALDRPGAGLVDTIIHEIGQLNGCTHIVTFDRKFARLEGVELLK